MKILMISSFLPYPLFTGGHIRLYNLLKLLQENHEVTLVCEKRSYQTIDDSKEVEKICKKVITVDRKKQWSPETIIKTATSFSPFLVVGHTNSQMKKAIEEELQHEKFDVIHIETFYVAQNIPKTTIPKVLVEHNVEYLVYKRYVDKAPVFLRPLLQIDIEKLKDAEISAWDKADALIAVSEDEKKLMQRDAVVVPNGVDLTKFRIMNYESRIMEKEKRLLFIGDFKWMQNKDAGKFILNDIWPSFAKASNGKPLLKLWVVGKNIPVDLKSLVSDDSVIFDEDAENTAKIYEKAFALLAPIRIGGGTSFKILEAMASGLPVITTSLGIEGIGKENNDVCLLAETAEEFEHQIERLQTDEKLYESTAKNARKLIEKKYDWKIIVVKLEKVYQNAIKSKP